MSFRAGGVRNVQVFVPVIARGVYSAPGGLRSATASGAGQPPIDRIVANRGFGAAHGLAGSQRLPPNISQRFMGKRPLKLMT